MYSDFALGNIKETSIQEILSGEKISELKNTMADGEWHHACRWCKNIESTGGQSGRTSRRIDSDKLAQIDQNIDWYTVADITVNWSNLCNLSCVYCNTETSTAWQSIKGIPINLVKNNHSDLIALAKTHGHDIRGLCLGGGEPLLQKGLVEFLKNLKPQQVNVMITTNLSVNLATNPVYQELKHWPHVDWMISFDNVNADKFEYVRDRADWKQFVSNIKQMQQDNQRILAHPAYSIYCAFDLMEYYEFCVEHNLDLFWCELNNPWELDARRLPLELRQLAVSEIDRVVDQFGSREGMALDTLQGYQQTLIDTSALFKIDHENYQFDVLAWHRDIESVLNKQHTFEKLWPELAAKIKELQ
jgi:organic radical activating enzyme